MIAAINQFVFSRKYTPFMAAMKASNKIVLLGLFVLISLAVFWQAGGLFSRRPLMVRGVPVYGEPVDQQTRCVHWHSDLDIIAIKFKCCQKYFPCFSCHEEAAAHKPEVWPRSEFDSKAILCGGCGGELTIRQYMGCNNICPNCGSAFNPGCRKHYHLYFEQDDAE